MNSSRPISLLSLILVLLQLLNPFLHAHAGGEGRADASGFHIHAQVGEFALGQPGEHPVIGSDDGGHRVLAMPTGNRDAQTMQAGLDQVAWMLTGYFWAPSAASPHAARMALPDSPLPRSSSDNPTPPALAPPLA